MAWFHSLSMMVLSFLPLWLLIFVRGGYALLWGGAGARGAEWCAVIGIPIMIAVSALSGHQLIRHFRLQKGRALFSIIECKEEKTVTIEFLVANVFPLFCFDSASGEGLALTITYFLVIASLAIRHKYFPANIWLEWFGWTFWRCKVTKCSSSECVLERMVVSKAQRLVSGAKVYLVSVNNDTLADMSKKDKEKEFK